MSNVSPQSDDAEVRRIRAKAERQKRLYEAIISSTPDLMYVFDLDYRFIMANEALLAMWGRTREESIGKTLLEIGYEPWHAEMHEREIRQVIETRAPVRGEVPFTHAQLGRRIYDYIFVPVLNQGGEVEAIAGTTRDVTEKVSAQEEIRRINESLEARVRDRTSALLSYQDQLRSLATELSRVEEQERHRLATSLHDNLGQLLSISKMKIDMLKTGSGGGSGYEVKELADLLDESIRYTRQLMSELKPPPAVDDEDAGTLIEWAVSRIEKHGLAVTIENDGEPKPLDKEIRATFLQCVRELMYNVYKHAGVDEAWVRLSRIDGFVEVVVEDRGKGFQMNGAYPVPTEEGGFGLFSINERMTLLGGSVEIESRPGEGTKIRLCAPIKAPVGHADGDEENTVQWPAGSHTGRSRGKSKLVRVLLVDDHQIMREGLRKLIEGEKDLTVIAEASDGNEGVRLARLLAPDVVVMDINLPVMNGMEATRKIAAESPGLRIVGLSLHEDRHVQQTMIDAGASACLSKAEVFETLCATIRSEARLAGNG